MTKLRKFRVSMYTPDVMDCESEIIHSPFETEQQAEEFIQQEMRICNTKRSDYFITPCIVIRASYPGETLSF